jgi:Ca-activated chloride channel family protein
MTFARPGLLPWVLPLLALLAVTVFGQWRRRRALGEAFGGPAAARRLTSRDLFRFPVGRLACLAAAGLAIGLAAAGVALGSGITFDSSRPVDLVVAIDVSVSMRADDVEPSRIERAKEVVSRLSETMPRERIGLVVFADWPYTLVPLTDDHGVHEFFIESLSVDLLGNRDQGTSLVAAVTHARELLEAQPRVDAERVILLLSDGESQEDEQSVVDSVALVAADGIRIWAAGLGTEAGAELIRPGSQGAPLLDDDGIPVITGLNESLLRRISDVGRGEFVDVSGESGLRNLLGRLRRAQDEGDGPMSLMFWLTLLALSLVLWEGVMDAGERTWSKIHAGSGK